MFAGQKYRPDSDSRSQDVREHNFHPRLWDRGVSRSRGRNRSRLRRLFGEVRNWFSARAKRQQLLRAGHAAHAPGVYRRRELSWRKRKVQRAHSAVAQIKLAWVLLVHGLPNSRISEVDVVRPLLN